MVAILVALFGPWVLFCVLYWIMTFSVHYKQPAVAYFVVFLGLVVVFACGMLAFNSNRKKAAGDPRRQPSWYAFTFVACMFAWLLAVIGGDINFYHHMQPYYDILNLNTYPSVDPTRMRGQQLMDAGRVIFVEGAKLDISKSMGFKNSERYCVAPITVTSNGEGSEPLETYDFWAVGTGCCSGEKADFHCPEFANPMAHGGLRLMRDDQRPYFRLAVQQAEAAYNIKAVHPLFFTWMQDPIAAVTSLKDEGYKYFLLGVLSHLSWQMFLVTVAALLFSRIGQL